MVEPPTTGFTGVIWEAKPAEQLARRLTTGPGARPLADAGAGWGRLALAFGAASVEYDQIMEDVRRAWRSRNSDAVVAHMSKLQRWLGDAAGSAADNARKTETQAAAYELARLEMPDADEIDAIHQAQTAIAGGTALGGPLLGEMARLDHQHDVAKMAASRVMRTYETATVPLAHSWTQEPPPNVTAGLTAPAPHGNTRADQAAAAMDARAAAMASEIASLPIPEQALAAAEADYPMASTGAVDEADAPVPVADHVAATTNAATPTPIVPGAAMAGVGGDEPMSRARPFSEGYTNLFAGDAGTEAAPPVLGDTERAATAQLSPPEATP